MLHLLRRRPSPAMVVALLALFVALDGPATAAHWVNGHRIKPNTITSRQVRNGSLAAGDLTRRARAALQRTPTNGVGTKQLQAKAVTTAKLADGAVGTGQLAGGAVGAGQLADGAVGPAKLAGGAVGAGQLAAGAVGSGHLATGAVTASKVANGSIGSDAVADGSLRTTDLADFAGAVQVNFTLIAATSCQANNDPITPQPSAPGKGSVIADDVILVTAPVGWPDQLLVTGNPGAGNTLRIIVCNPTKDPITVPDNVKPVFQYIGIDQP